MEELHGPWRRMSEGEYTAGADFRKGERAMLCNLVAWRSESEHHQHIPVAEDLHRGDPVDICPGCRAPWGARPMAEDHGLQRVIDHCLFIYDDPLAATDDGAAHLIDTEGEMHKLERARAEAASKLADPNVTGIARTWANEDQAHAEYLIDRLNGDRPSPEIEQPAAIADTSDAPARP